MSSTTPNNSGQNNKSITSASRILNRFMNTTNSSENLISNAQQSTLNVITSAAVAAVSSFQNMLSNNSLSSQPCSSSSSSANSSAQNTPNTFRDLTNQNIENAFGILPTVHTSLITSTIKIEKKHFDKVKKLADKLLKHCQSERMNLINSPPYIIDILPDICHVFDTIYVVYENKLHLLNDLDYFCVLIKNCIEKFQELIDLFKLAGKKMYEENSVERQKLVKYTLTYSHMLAEMKSIFPKDVYEGQSFRIAKKDAADFWKTNFGDRVMVSWKEFEIKLNSVHKISNQMEVDSLRETIQLTRTKYVSIFEFDIFTRLFQPWNNLLNNWKFLVTEHPGYSAFSTYDEVHKRLQKHILKPGSYLFRLSCTKLGQWAIGYVTEGHKILQTIPQSLIQALIDGQKQGMYIYPDGRDIKIDISSAIAVTSASRIQISKEQYDMYCDIGTSFQVCKICAENNKDRILEPCGHLICSTCLENWQEFQPVPSCPFCRCEIKTFEPVIISPFENINRKESLKSESSYLNDDNKTIDSNLIVKDCSITQSPVSTGSFVDTFVSSKNVAILSNKTSSLCTQNDLAGILIDSEDYLHPNKLGNCSESRKCSSINVEQTSDPSKYNLDLILNNKCNLNEPQFPIASVLIGSKETPNESIRLSKLPQAPSFPPPLPPSTVPPELPAGPPPIPPSYVAQTIVSNQATSKQNQIKLKIDNENLFEQLLSTQMSGNDRIKAACALYLANNDVKTAISILNLSKI